MQHTYTSCFAQAFACIHWESMYLALKHYKYWNHSMVALGSIHVCLGLAMSHAMGYAVG